MEDFYRDARSRLGILMDGEEPAGGRWNYDADNREPPPRSASLGVPEPEWPTEPHGETSRSTLNYARVFDLRFTSP